MTTDQRIILLQGIVILLLAAIEIAYRIFCKAKESKRQWDHICREHRLVDRVRTAETCAKIWENRYLYLAEQMARVQLYAHRGDLKNILKITKEANTYEHVDRRNDGLDSNPFCGAGHHVVHASAGAKTQKNAAEPVGADPGEGR